MTEYADMAVAWADDYCCAVCFDYDLRDMPSPSLKEELLRGLQEIRGVTSHDVKLIDNMIRHLSRMM